MCMHTIFSVLVQILDYNRAKMWYILSSNNFMSLKVFFDSVSSFDEHNLKRKIDLKYY